MAEIQSDAKETFQYAGFFRRLGANIIDIAIISLIATLLILIPLAIKSGIYD